MASLFEKLMANKDTANILDKLQPSDIVMAIMIGAKLEFKEATSLAKKLYAERSLSIEPNMQYPVPPQSRGPKSEVEESTPFPVIPRHHFPPDPRSRPSEWPYDAGTSQAMNPKNRGRKRPLTTGKDVGDKKLKPVFKGPLDTDFRQQPTSSAPASGVYQKTFHSKDNNTPSSSSSWSIQGYPGWSRSPKDKEYNRRPTGIPFPIKAELPIGNEEKEEEPSFLKSPTVGAPSATIGGRSPFMGPKAVGHRGWGRR